MNHAREQILQRLMHEQHLTFNQLWAKQGPSNKFAYHLTVLEEDGLIIKDAKGYCLTSEGKKLSGYLEGATGGQAKFPIIATIIVLFDKTEKKVLMMQRKKEPFYGYWGFMGGKIRFDQYILECAQTELKEESGLNCSLELKGLFSSKTYHGSELAFNHQLFIVSGKNPRGRLIGATREGESQWIPLTEVKKLQRFPNIEYLITIAKSKKFRWIEEDRWQKDDVFIGMKEHKNQTI